MKKNHFSSSAKPQQLVSEEKTEIVDSGFNQGLLSKFTQFMSRHRNDQLREGVKNIYGRHYPINFNSSYNFKQQWQSKQKQFEQNNYYELIQTQNWLAYVYTVLLLLFNVLLFWFITVYRLLELNHNNSTSTLLLISIAVTIIDSLIKYILKYICTQSIAEWKEVLLTFKKQIYLVAYYLLNLIGNQFYQENTADPLYLLDLIAVYIIYQRAKGLFRHFKIRSYTTAYKIQFKLLDLLTNLFIVQHIFTILLYLVSYYDSTNNWLIHIGHNNLSKLQKLYYSFYFTSTTMLTIGYGDIIPVNEVEIACVLVVQIFGVAIFSYIINQIGYTLSSIRKEEEELEHNLSTLVKMCKYYSLQPELANLAKSYLISNQQSIQEIYPSQENQVLMKLNDDLRTAITQEYNLSIIKSSIFFICHWSKRFQAEIAKKLVKKILNPNQYIIQTPGKEKIYIIKSGKLQIYTNNCLGFKKNFKKLLKTIEPSSTVDVSDNVYGYTSMFSHRTLKLNAISKDFTCVYYVDKTYFLQSVNDHKLDYEYYFEIKAKIESSKFGQSWEAPSILNIREHYRPNQIYLIKKTVGKNKKLKNHRKYMIRYDRNDIIRPTNLFKNFNEQIDRMSSTAKQIRITNYFQPSNASKQNQGENDHTQESFQLTKTEVLNQLFEVAKQYQNYFKRNNLGNILRKLQHQNYTSNKYVECQEQYPNNPILQSKKLVQSAQLGPKQTPNFQTNRSEANFKSDILIK